MKSWSGFSSCLNPFLSFLPLVIFLVTSVTPARVFSQDFNAARPATSLSGQINYSEVLRSDSIQAAPETLPDPMNVMYKSLMIPGWGQITNKQAWKVPIVYGLLGGLTWYSIYLTKKYHDYRAAYYNLNPDTPDDLRFGATPSYIPQNANLQALRSGRNFLRNRRDFIYITIGMAYGLNVIDAYVFAHMRSFDVSEDLSVRTSVKPAMLGRVEPAPGVTLSFELFNRSKSD